MSLATVPTEQRIAFLPVGQLRIDHLYQRTLMLPKVKKMAASWSDAKADSITVSARPNGFYVLDGQHRLAAARMAGVHGLWALIHTNLGQDQEAALWVALNTERSRPKATQIFRAKLASNDDDAQALQRVCAELGWAIQVSDNTIALPHRTVAIGTLERLLERGGEELVRTTILVVGQAWPEDSNHGKADVLEGVGLFIHTYRNHPGYTTSRLIAKLSEKPLLALRQRMQAMYTFGSAKRGGDQSRARKLAVLEAYNRDLRKGHLPETWKEMAQ